MARPADLVFDAAHPASLAHFWAAALDGYAVAPYDAAEIERLRSIGITDPEDDPTVLVEPSDGTGVRLWFQRVPEPKTVKNRVHIDLRSDDPPAEIDRLVALGAQVDPHQGHPRLVVLRDPEGNEFCMLLEPG